MRMPDMACRSENGLLGTRQRMKYEKNYYFYSYYFFFLSFFFLVINLVIEKKKKLNSK